MGGSDDAGDPAVGLSSKTPPDVITGYNWELYNVREDPTESEDLAAKMPDKLKEMQDLFYAEARKNNVLPLDNSTLPRWNAPRPSLTAGRRPSPTPGNPSVPSSGAPSILNKAYTITAEVEIPEGGAEGMIVTDGGRFGGYGLFLSRANSASAGQAGVPLQPARPQAHHLGGPRTSRRQHTSSSTSSRTARPGQGRHGVLSSTARKSPETPWTTPRRSPSRKTSLRLGQDTRTPLAPSIPLRRPVQVHRQDRQADLRLGPDPGV